jgi:hypothetical protein
VKTENVIFELINEGDWANRESLQGPAAGWAASENW